MAWKYGQKTLRVGKAWVDDEGFKHPPSWVQWTDSNKKKWGVTWEDDPTPLAPFDSFYYSGYDSDGNLVGKTLSTLQSLKVTESKLSSASYLSRSDWYVVRKSETNAAIPSKVTAFRTAVRANYASEKTAINAASDIDELIALYETTAGASSTTKEIDGTDSDVVSASDNKIVINGHGYVDDEIVYYTNGGADDSIGGLVDGKIYYVFEKTTNDFKLSESHSNCGDAAAVSLSVADSGTSHSFTSQGIPNLNQTWPNFSMSKYDGS